MFLLSQRRKRDLRGSAALLLVLLAIPISILAQQPDPANELWRERARNITEDLIVDGSKLPPLRRAVLRARLAESWWRDDQRRALGWLTMAVETVEQVPEQESLEDRRERLETTGLLLKTALRMDRKLSQRLLLLLTNEDNTKGIGGLERLENADSLMIAASSIVDLDSTRAAELGALALRFGPPSDVATLLFPLYRRNVRLADQFLGQSMAVAKQLLWGELLNSLTRVVFAKERGWAGEQPPVPENARSELLHLLIAYLNASQNDLNCADVLFTIAPLLSEFERLMPQQAAVARQAINQCQTLMPLSSQQILDRKLNTVEGLLKAAADTDEPCYRANFEFQAANVARSNKDYDRSMKILDGMSKKSRECLGSSWATNRWAWAAEGAFVLLRVVVKYDPAAASAAFKEAAASLNRADQKDQKTLDSGNLLDTLPAALLEMDEFAVKDGLASIASVETRAQLRLDLLQATLRRIKTQ